MSGEEWEQTAGVFCCGRKIRSDLLISYCPVRKKMSIDHNPIQIFRYQTYDGRAHL